MEQLEAARLSILNEFNASSAERRWKLRAEDDDPDWSGGDCELVLAVDDFPVAERIAHELDAVAYFAKLYARLL